MSVTRRICILAIFSLSCIGAFNAHAATVSYTLENVWLDDTQQMTGTFSWTYTAGDFENGEGLFSEIYVPRYGTDLSGLVITTDTSSIEVSLLDNLDSRNIGLSLKLIEPFTPTTGSLLDLTVTESKWEDFDGGKHPFISGSITPVVSSVPVPAAAWLFGSALLGLAGVARRKRG
jgi:hypothetical protein